MSNYIYLDHAATTPLDPAVLAIMSPYFTDYFYNAGSRYAPAETNKRVINQARETVANILGARPAEIIFTSGGSESDNLAIKGVAYAQKQRGRDHIITAPTEHHAVLNTVKFLEEQGFKITYLVVDQQGQIEPQAVKAAITPQTALITLMYANNEVGTIYPLAEIGKIAREAKVPFHTDAVQAGGSLPLNVESLNVDLLSLSAHKFYGPKGVGALFVRRGTPFEPQIHGGEQERSRRAGTENIPGIVGMATALERAYRYLAENNRQLSLLRDRLIEGVLANIPNARLNGAPPPDRLPNNASFCFEGVNGETSLLGLEERGILCSSGSACAAGSSDPSHVLTAMGYAEDLAHTAVRLTPGKTTTETEIDYTINALKAVIETLI
jgi:cysteine desulfurase